MNKYYQLVESEEVSELYIFGDIVDEAWCENDVAGSSLCKEIKALNTKQINVYINSYGGSVASGLGIYNQLKSHPAKVTTYCQGFACSISSVIFMAGDERIMSNASLLMIHNAWTIAQGNAKDLRKQADDLDKITQASINAYMERVNIEEAELVELLDNESWLTAEECLEMGFATEIVKEEATAVSQSVKQSLVDMIKQKCKTDEEDKKKKCQAEDEEPQSKVLRCPECDYEGEMAMEDDYYVCPECGYKFKEEEPDDMDDDIDDEDDDVEEKCKKKKKRQEADKEKQGAELKVMSSFLNLFN